MRRAHVLKAVIAGLLAAGLLAGALDCGRRHHVAASLEPSYGTLEVRSDPAGATILVDGTDYRAVTPDDFTLTSGAHHVSVSLAGHVFAPASTTLAVPGNGTATYTFLEFAPRLVPDTTAHDFGRQALDTASPNWCLAVTNAGRADADSGAFALAGADAGEYAIVSGGTWRHLAPGAVQQVCVAFRPAHAGVAHATLQVGETPVALAGTGYKVPCVLEPSAAAHDFGPQDVGLAYPAWCFEITNHDAGRCADTLQLSGADAGEFAIVSGGVYDLAPGAAQTVCVAFRPTGAGWRGANLVVGSTTVSLTGIGMGSCQLASPTAPDGTDFGAVCTDSVAGKRLQLANSGNLACTVRASGCGDVVVTPASAGVPPGGAATFAVSYQPSSPGVAASCPVVLTDGTNTWTTTFTGSAISAPLADFTPSGGTAGHAGSPIPFTPTVQANGSAVSSYAWDFGDGATSTLPAPSHRFAAGGPYTVTLTVTNGCGVSPVMAHTICIDEPAYVELYGFDSSTSPDYSTNIPGWGSTVPLVLYRGSNAAYGATPSVVCTNSHAGEILQTGRDAITNLPVGASEALGMPGQSFATAQLPVDPGECSVTANFTIGAPSWASLGGNTGPTFYVKVGPCGHQALGMMSGSNPDFCVSPNLNNFHCTSPTGDGRLEWGLEPITTSRWVEVNAVRFTFGCWYVCPGGRPQTGPVRVVPKGGR